MTGLCTGVIGGEHTFHFSNNWATIDVVMVRGGGMVSYEGKTGLAPTKTLPDVFDVRRTMYFAITTMTVIEYTFQFGGGDYEPECREASLSDAGWIHARIPDSDCLLSGADG
jgi:hypothetical protein